MDVLQDSRFIERQQFFNGQRLFADDLQYIEAFNREMRWLHNRSLHQWGIGGGLDVHGKKGDRQVLIGPGYAIDDLGREIVLTEGHLEPIPPVAGADGDAAAYYLVVSYGDSEDLEDVEKRQGVCSRPGAVRKGEAPVFCWVRLIRNPVDDTLQPDHSMGTVVNDVETGRRIVLARIKVKNCKLSEDLSIIGRRSANVDCGPYIECGTASADSWQVIESAPTAPDHSIDNIDEIDTFVGELESGLLSDKLRALFSTRNINLTKNTKVIVEQSGNRWAIFETYKKYIIRREINSLLVYQQGRYTLYAILNTTTVQTDAFRSFAVLLLRAHVSTTTAAFTTTPCYSVSVEGRREIKVKFDDHVQSIDVILVESQPRLSNVTKDGFDVSINVVALRPNDNSNVQDPWLAAAIAQWIVGESELHDPKDPAKVLYEANWSIDWMGVEA